MSTSTEPLRSGPPPVRVLVADDHPLYRQALVATIEQHDELEIVAEVDDGERALAEIRRLVPDVAVLDMQMPGLKGSDVVRELVELHLPTRVLLLSAHGDSATVYGALGAGAAGYMLKGASAAAIGRAVVDVSRGEVVLGAEVQAGVAREIHERENAGPKLTARELEILVLTADGHSAPAIAARLFLGTSTVKTHLQGLYMKLGVSDRAAAVAEAMRRGLLR